ncbi:MAG: RNA polymerase sigma factor [Planctomycetota bacterium]|jgi:RNA polymerase sigma factor (sigma-70 family)
MATTTQLAASVMEQGTARARLEHALLFERVMGRIHRYFRRTLSDPADAEDCAQETMLLIERSLKAGTYDKERSFNTWLWLKARTVFAQWCRRRERTLGKGKVEEHAPSGEGGAAPDGTVRVAEQLDAEVLLGRVRQELGLEVYETFVLTYESGMSQRELAAALQIDPKTLRKQIAAAHRVIGRALEAEGES